jgi:hypothetical protein
VTKGKDRSHHVGEGYIVRGITSADGLGKVERLDENTGHNVLTLKSVVEALGGSPIDALIL